jgi:hypothetical protein
MTSLKVDKMTQEKIEKRIKGAGYTEPDTFVLAHGYCRSVYIKDPTVCSSNSRSMLPTPTRSPRIARRMRTPPATVGSRATTRRTTCIGRALLGRFVEESVTIQTAEQISAADCLKRTLLTSLPDSSSG